MHSNSKRVAYVFRRGGIDSPEVMVSTRRKDRVKTLLAYPSWRDVMGLTNRLYSGARAFLGNLNDRIGPGRLGYKASAGVLAAGALAYSPAKAADVYVDSGMSNTEVMSVLNNLNDGDIVNWA